MNATPGIEQAHPYDCLLPLWNYSEHPHKADSAGVGVGVGGWDPCPGICIPDTGELQQFKSPQKIVSSDGYGKRFFKKFKTTFVKSK